MVEPPLPADGVDVNGEERLKCLIALGFGLELGDEEVWKNKTKQFSA